MMLKMLVRMLHAARISQLAEYKIVTTNIHGMNVANMLLAAASSSVPTLFVRLFVYTYLSTNQPT